MRKDILVLIILLTLGFWSVRPLFTPGFFPMHDDTQVGRVVAMGKALRQGQFPVRWAADLGYGYGYPIFNFYGPLPYYIGGIFYAVGLSGLLSTKIIFGLGIILAGVSMYFVASRFFGRMGGLLAGLFYLYAPYHAVDIYVRGAVGESWALIFLPLVVWGVLQIKKAFWRRALLVGSLGLAGVILSHTILGYVSVFFYLFGFVLFAFTQLAREKFDIAMLSRLGLILAVGLALSAYFWLPAISEMKYTNVAAQVGGGADFHDHFVCLPQLWDSPWGFGGSAKGCVAGLSFKLGKLHVLVALAAVSGWLWQRRRLKDLKPAMILATAILVVSVILLLNISTKFWELAPYFSYIQYPWRFLTFAILGLSFLGGGVAVLVKNVIVRIGLVLVLALILLAFNAKLFLPQYIYIRPTADFESDSELRWRVSKISDEYLPPDFVKPNGPNEIPGGALSAMPDMKVKTIIDTGTYAKYDVAAAAAQEVTISRAYFPGWKYIVNGQEIQAKISKGLPHVNFPEGTFTSEISLGDTPVRTIGNLISLLSVVSLLTIYGRKTYS